MNWLILACFLISLASGLVALSYLGLAVRRVYRAGRVAQRETTPRVKYILAAQEQAMVVADRIAQRQVLTAESTNKVASSLTSLTILMDELLAVQRRLSMFPVD